MSANYTATCEVYARTYSEAIEQVGRHMDSIWENGHWELISCEAEPHVQMAHTGEILGWRWDFKVRWLGLV